MDLVDAQWAVLEPTFRARRWRDGRGRPWADARAVLNGVLWVLRSGAPWADLPRRYPPYQPCHRHFQQWQVVGGLIVSSNGSPRTCATAGRSISPKPSWDATYAGAEKGAPPSVLHAVAKAPKSWRSATAMVFLSPCTWPVLHRHEPHLVHATLDARFFPELPPRLIGDRGYDSDLLDAQLRQQYGIDMIAPNRTRRRRTQDGRPLRHYRRHWESERLFAWLQNSRRLVTRWEIHVENFLGMLQLACARILLRMPGKLRNGVAPIASPEHDSRARR